MKRGISDKCPVSGGSVRENALLRLVCVSKKAKLAQITTKSADDHLRIYKLVDRYRPQRPNKVASMQLQGIHSCVLHMTA